MHHLLDLVQHEMLLPTLDERITIGTLVHKLQVMEQRCREDPLYCTEAMPWPTNSRDQRKVPLPSLSTLPITAEAFKPLVMKDNGVEPRVSFGDHRLSKYEGLRYSQIIQMSGIFEEIRVSDSLGRLLRDFEFKFEVSSALTPDVITTVPGSRDVANCSFRADAS